MSRLKERARGLLRRAGGRGGIGAATVAVIVILVVIVNVIVTALASRYSWYLYTSPRYEHEIGNSSETLFSDLDQGRELKIRFCMKREDMEGDSAFRLVLETARQFSEKYAFISVDFLNIVVMPGNDGADIERYKYGAAPALDENGKKIKKNAVTERSVVFDAGGNDFTVATLQSFFILDSQQYITGYDGERVMSALIHRTMAEKRPLACFTIGHGETSNEQLYNILVCAGYEIRTVDLAKEELPAETSLVVISNPLYDFETSAEGSGITSEIDRLTAFGAGEGNTVFAVLDPLITDLPHLNA